MIHVKCEKKDNYPHDREIILFDRNAFQSLGDEGLCKVNEKYNILCPQVFVIECLAPNRASEKEKKTLRRRLELIENPIVLIGNTHISPLINRLDNVKRLELIENPIVLIGNTHISPLINRLDNVEYSGILTAEQIARNCIISNPITMERVTPEKLISHYEPRIGAFKKEMKKYTETCDSDKASLTKKRLISKFRRLMQRKNNRDPSDQEIQDFLRENNLTRITPETDYAATEALREIENKSVDENIELLKNFLFLKDTDTKKLRDRIQDRNRSRLTVENYPDLAYPIYVYYLSFYMMCARQHNTKHLDKSYVRDFRYLHYLNFCDRFITQEKSARYIVNSIPYNDIKNTTISSLKELKRELTEE